MGRKRKILLGMVLAIFAVGWIYAQYRTTDKTITGEIWARPIGGDSLELSNWTCCGGMCGVNDKNQYIITYETGQSKVLGKVTDRRWRLDNDIEITITTDDGKRADFLLHKKEW